MQRRSIDKLAALAALAALLSACATHPPSDDQVKPVPADRVLAYQTHMDDGGTLVVTRDTGMMGGGCFLLFSIDGTAAARYEPSETATFYIASGEHVLRVGRDPNGAGLCVVGPEEWTQRETILRTGETKRFRISTDANGKKDIQRAE